MGLSRPVQSSSKQRFSNGAAKLASFEALLLGHVTQDLQESSVFFEALDSQQASPVATLGYLLQINPFFKHIGGSSAMSKKMRCDSQLGEAAPTSSIFDCCLVPF